MRKLLANWQKIALGVFIFALLVLLLEGVYYLRLSKKEEETPTEKEVLIREEAPVKEEEIAEEEEIPLEMVAVENVDVFLSPGQDQVGRFVVGQEFTLTGEEEKGYVQVLDSDGYKLWIKKSAAYEPSQK